MEAFLELELIWREAVLLASALAVGALVHWLTHYSSLAPRCRTYRGVVAPFFMSVGILFSLFAAFLGQDIWSRVAAHDHAIEREADAIQDMLQIAGALEDHGDIIRRDVGRYLRATLEGEWETNLGPRAPDTERALQALVRDILSPALEARHGAAAQSALMARYQAVRDSRATRRHIADTHSDSSKWAVVMVLGFMTQAAIAFVHLDDRRAQAAALTIFSLGFAVAVLALGSHERPLSNPALYGVAELRDAQKSPAR